MCLSHRIYGAPVRGAINEFEQGNKKPLTTVFIPLAVIKMEKKI